MDVKIIRNIDSDTDKVILSDGRKESLRYLWGAGFESKKSPTNKGKISARGIQQAKDVATLTRPGTKMTIDDDPERGTFDRILSYPTVKRNGKDVDENF